MGAEPITLFSHTIDPKGVLDVLRGMAPDLDLVGSEDNWERVTITGRRRFLRKPESITFTQDGDYYVDQDWGDQIGGMQGYFSRFPTHDLTGRLMMLIATFRFAVGTVCEPDLDVTSQDERARYVLAVAKHLDAVIFTPSALRDAAGRVLIDSSGEPHPDAVVPAIRVEVPAQPRDELPRSQGGTLPDEDSLPPPTAERVARRALSLAALCGRALLEQEDHSDPDVEDTRRRILRWVDEVGLGDEIEPDEWEVMQRPVGKLELRAALNAMWRLEGLAVLAWALGRLELPPHDQTVDPGTLLPAVGILNANRAKALLAEPALRPADELKVQSDRLFAIHWRLRNFRLKPEAMNFTEFARTAWFGPLNIDSVRLIDEDLAVGDSAIVDADREAVGSAESAAMERHQAINWLQGYAVRYSEVDTPT